MIIPESMLSRRAVRKRQVPGDSLAGPSKRRRSRSPPRRGPVNPSSVPPSETHQPSPPVPAPAPSLPSRPVPPSAPRRSPSPVPPPPTARPPAEVDLTADSPPERREAGETAPSPRAPTLAEIFRVGSAASSSGGGQSSGPSASADGVFAQVPVLRPSYLNNPKFADKLLSAACPEVVREELVGVDTRVLLEEGSAALFRAVNTFFITKLLVSRANRRAIVAQQESAENRRRAERAEGALRAAEEALHAAEEALQAERAEGNNRVADACRQLEDQLREAREQAEVNNSRALGAERKLARCSAELSAARDNVLAAEDAARSAEMRRARAAADAAGMVRVVEKLRDKVKAVKARMGAVAEEAVARFRDSPAFVDEVAEAAADAYLVGFERCKKMVGEMYDLGDLHLLQPGEVDEEAGDAVAAVGAVGDAVGEEGSQADERADGEARSAAVGVDVPSEPAEEATAENTAAEDTAAVEGTAAEDTVAVEGTAIPENTAAGDFVED